MVALTELEAILINVMERDFNTYCELKIFSELTIIETDGGFVLTFKVKNLEGERTLYSARKAPRVWVNLNSLVNFIKKHNIGIGEITLRLNSNRYGEGRNENS